MTTESAYNKYALLKFDETTHTLIKVFDDFFAANDWVKENGKRGEKYLVIPADVIIVI